VIFVKKERQFFEKTYR